METDNPDAVIDVERAERKVWLVKVPAHFYDALYAQTEETTVGAVHMSGTGAKMRFDVEMEDSFIADGLALSGEYSEQVAHKPSVLKNYELRLHPANESNVAAVIGRRRQNETSEYALEGTIARRCDLRPPFTKEYREMNRARAAAASDQKRSLHTPLAAGKTPKLDYNPVFESKEAREEKKRKLEVGKRDRMPEGELRDRLLVEFERHQYYSLRTLTQITNQPQAYLKQILKEMCVFHTKGELRNYYELKPEYQANDDAMQV